MFCPACGSSLSMSASRCDSCGARVNGASPTEGLTASGGFGASLPLATSVPSYEEIVTTGYDLPVGAILEEAWGHFKTHSAVMVGGTVILSALAVALSTLPFGAVLSTPLMAGAPIVALRLLSQSPADYAGFFDGFKKWLPLLLLGVVSGALTMLGTLFLVLPGIYLAIAFSWATWLVVDRDEDFWPALMSSLRVVNAGFGANLLFLLALGGLNLLGAMCLGVGMLVTGPLSVLATGVAYRRVFGIAGGAERLR